MGKRKTSPIGEKKAGGESILGVSKERKAKGQGDKGTANKNQKEGRA